MSEAGWWPAGGREGICREEGRLSALHSKVLGSRYRPPLRGQGLEVSANHPAFVPRKGSSAYYRRATQRAEAPVQGRARLARTMDLCDSAVCLLMTLGKFSLCTCSQARERESRLCPAAVKRVY